MQFFSIIEQPVSESHSRPQEDYLAVSDSPPIFVVSDGVTLDTKKLLENNTEYPNPSPAGKVAKIFCEAVVKSVQEKYEGFNLETILQVFREANNEVGKYNQKIGKSDISGNPTGFYAATGSFVIVKESKACWASICDSFVAFFDKDMNLKLMSSGLCKPYAVINGEERMAAYLEKGVFNLEKDDKIFVFTDGFEQYVKNADFLKIFEKWDSDLKDRVAEFSKEMGFKNPQKYGDERSLVVILV